MNRREIYFGTSNLHKLDEAKRIFNGLNIDIIHYPVELIEPQESSLEKIAVYSLNQLTRTDREIFVEDTGLFIETLKGFPGPYAAYAFKTINNAGIIKLMEAIENRKAYFESWIAFRDIKGVIHTFKGQCKGKISLNIDGEHWGFDPIFIPEENRLNPEGKTFSRLGDEIKNKISHRSKALEEFKKFLVPL